jgi:predicted transcriptional regulator
MKTAVSLPDDVFRNADRLARKLGKSRSQLYGEALIEYRSRHSADSVTEAMDRALAEFGNAHDEFSRAAARRVLGRTEW